MAGKPTIFISYSHKDAQWKERLASHLGVLQGQDHLDFWTDDGIRIGDTWVRKIQDAITTANAAILLVSADFLTSPFIRRVEIAQLLERREKEGLPIFPILVRQCAWDLVSWLEPLQMRPFDAKPLAGHDEYQIDVHLTAIVREIKGVLDRLAAVESAPPLTKEEPRGATLLTTGSARGDLPSVSISPPTAVMYEWEREHVPAAPVIIPPLPALAPTFRNSIGMEFVLIPAGEFRMGSENGFENEKPVHLVRITKPFYLGKYQVTQGQWEVVMGTNPSHFKGDPQRPVEQVSWEDTQEFLRRLGEQEGKSYRLPTEAEWEYAARAGSSGAYCFGDGESQLKDYAWYAANAKGTTHPVGQLKPNAWGLYDVHGNVWEWCHDGQRTYTSASVSDPLGPTTAGADRVIRGGYWHWGAQLVRSAFRNAYSPGVRDGDLGFRCASSE